MPPTDQMPQPQYNPQPSSGPDNPYEFFMDDNAQKKGKLGGGLQLSDGTGPNKKLFIILGIILLLVFIGIMVAIVVGSGKKPIPLNGVVRVQQEILIITTDALKNGQGDDVKNIAVTANATMSTAQKDAVAQVVRHGIKISEKDMAAIQPAASKALAAAIPANTYDSTFKDAMKSELAKYDVAINASIAVAANQQELNLLKKLKADGDVLDKQLAGYSQ